MSVIGIVACLAAMSGAAQHFSEPSLLVDHKPMTDGRRLLPEVASVLSVAESALSRDPNKSMFAANAILMIEPLRYYSESALEIVVDSSVKAWENALPGIQFKKVQRASKADILFLTATNLRMNGEILGGFATWQRFDDGSRPIKATVQIQIDQPNGSAMTDCQLKHIVGHEIGHLLGLADSVSDNELMGPLNLSRPVLRATEPEVRALSQARNMAWEIRRQAAISILNLSDGYNAMREARRGPTTELPRWRRG